MLIKSAAMALAISLCSLAQAEEMTLEFESKLRPISLRWWMFRLMWFFMVDEVSILGKEGWRPDGADFMT
jgi:hypothetical protein